MNDRTPAHETNGTRHGKCLRGWKEICGYIGLSVYLIKRQRYPVYRLFESRQVWAMREDIDAHMARLLDICRKRDKNRSAPG